MQDSSNELTGRIDGGPSNLPRQLTAIDRRYRQIDRLANYYGQLFRSSAVSRYLLIIAMSLLYALINILFPAFFPPSLIVQGSVTVWVLIDTTIGNRRRWQERWLEYRWLAERLKSLRFLQPLAAGAGNLGGPFASNDQTWMDWYIRRSSRALSLPSDSLNAKSISAAAELVFVAISEQVAYHRNVVAQLGTLERRLSFAAKAALVVAIIVAFALGGATYFLGSANLVWWKPIANVLIGALPAAMIAFNGIRSDADLVRLVERSAITEDFLLRLQGAISSGSQTYDRVSVTAKRLASLMASELSEWKFVFESRRARVMKRQRPKKG